MKNVLIHGLGQNDKAWDIVIKELPDIKVTALNLYNFLKNTKTDYDTLLASFTDYCNGFDEKLNLCGLSLGGILALDYVKKHPEKVNSIILIGTPYKIHKLLFKAQNLIFHLMPKSTFEKIGMEKKNFIYLVNSMGDLNMSNNLNKIKCPVLILCGRMDKQNMKGAELLNKNIKNSTFKVVDNATHEVNVDNPQKLAKLIADFWHGV